ncbi:sortase A [Salsuginibacillus halophilus]|uniref:Sortase A n=1 Tax=Salsuginibacillus halophilus TaxID=517424 RepID=A0A2P8HAM6_9BACI|nr:class D sortase [Salsuginibacillus halophilus]PSL43264.1 sortase A [Salsuginibacillus halophilus]
MRFKIGILVIALGLVFAGFSGYQWVAGASGVSKDPEAAQSVSDNWDDTERQEIYNVEELEQEEDSNASDDNVAAAAEEETDDPYDRDYAYEEGEEMAEMSIPTLERVYPIYWGTNDDALDQGVGLHEGDHTATPDELVHTVLSGHRDTVFSEMGDLEEGDRIYLDYDGKTYEYQIRDTWITDADDRTVIVKKDEPTLTLTTCYPFTYVGPAPDRYIIEAELTNIED